MTGRPHHAPHRAAAWAAGLLLAITGLPSGAVQAQTAPPPAPRLPPIPQLPLFGPPAYGPAPSGSCNTVDWTCRIDALERRVVELEREADRGDRGGRRGRGVEMSVERDCISDSCPSLASTLCTNAGFARGVPVEVRQNGAWQRLVRAACLD